MERTFENVLIFFILGIFFEFFEYFFLFEKNLNFKKSPINQNDLSKISKIKLIVNDKEREYQKEVLGYCLIEIDTTNQNLQDFTENMLTKTGVKMQASLHFRVKLVLSQVNIQFFFNFFDFLLKI